MRVRLESVGCRLNIGEIESLARRLAAAGHRIVASDEPADLCILNSCAVTSNASRTSRRVVSRLRRRHPAATLVVTGCYAQLAPGEVRGLGVDLVVGNPDKDRLPELVERLELPHGSRPGDAHGSGARRRRRTRAFVKIQDGCDSSCAFCIVTVARGPGRSRPPGEVVAEVRSLHAAGYCEAVLTGVHLGSYGHDLGSRHGLSDLVQRILDETEIPRIRLSSLEPWDLDEPFFELLGSPQLLPHLHLPLQSGCDATLRRMGRRTSRSAFARLVAAARSARPEVSVSTDIMVGFPGETEREFAESLAFVETMAFSRLHVFRFSLREGTRAAAMPDQVPARVSLARSRSMHLLADRLERRFNRGFVGATLPVLWEQPQRIGPRLRWSGLTDNYIRAVTETDLRADLDNRVTDTRIVAAVVGGVLGSVDGVSLDTPLAAAPGTLLPVR